MVSRIVRERGMRDASRERVNARNSQGYVCPPPRPFHVPAPLPLILFPRFIGSNFALNRNPREINDEIA